MYHSNNDRGVGSAQDAALGPGAPRPRPELPERAGRGARPIRRVIEAFRSGPT